MALPKNRALANVLRNFDSPTEASQCLKKLEQVVHTNLPKGLAQVRTAALAFHEIKSRKLYLLKAESWEAYLGAGFRVSPRAAARVLALRVDDPDRKPTVVGPDYIAESKDEITCEAEEMSEGRSGITGRAESVDAVLAGPLGEKRPGKPREPSLRELVNPGITVIEDLVRTLRTVARKVDGLIDVPGTDFVDPTLVNSALQEAIRSLGAALPWAPCGHCWGKQADTACTACRSPRTGKFVRWLPRIRWKQQADNKKRKWDIPSLSQRRSRAENADQS